MSACSAQRLSVGGVCCVRSRQHLGLSRRHPIAPETRGAANVSLHGLQPLASAARAGAVRRLAFRGTAKSRLLATAMKPLLLSGPAFPALDGLSFIPRAD